MCRFCLTLVLFSLYFRGSVQLTSLPDAESSISEYYLDSREILKCICNEKFDIYFFAFCKATLYRDHNAANQMIICNLEKSYKPSKLAILAYRTRNRAMVRDFIPRIRKNECFFIMASTSKSCERRGGQYCVAGLPNRVSCQNGQYTERKSIHEFPNISKEKSRHQSWLSFVRKDRPNWNSTNSSILCSDHFDESCFARNRANDMELGMKIR